MREALGDTGPLLNLLPREHLLGFNPAEAEGLNAAEHFVHFYENDSVLIDSITRFVGAGLQAGDTCIVIGTQTHRELLAGRLLSHGYNVINNGLGDRYFAFDAETTLARFRVNQKIDPQRFDQTVGEIIRQADLKPGRVRAFGEMVGLLASAGDFAGAVQLEELWNALRTKHKFSLFCAYSLSSFIGQNSAALIDLCRQHSRVVPAESYTGVSNEEERLRAIVVLQQKALALEAEITEREKAEAALRSLSHDLTKSLLGEQLARSEAEMANRMKDEFVATVSHELRTPLNAIIGWTHVLRTEERNQAARERAVDTIERNARALAQLVEDLLDVSRIITGKLQLNIGEVEMAGIINAAIESIQPAATSKEIQLSVNLDPDVNRISGDAGRLQQIVWNLLSNAIKFTPPGGHVEVSLQRRDNGVCITVSDSGKGIDPTFLPFIFERFRQADGSTTRKFGGLGLGLSIVRHLVELHGGTVQAHSEGEGKGATFTLRLPNAIQIVPAKRAGSASLIKTGEVTLRSIAGQNILLVDQDEGVLRTLAGALTAHGAKVEFARSARNAIEVLEHFHPDVIVSGLVMPEHYQYSLIQMIRAQETGERKMAQAIALTALVRVQDPNHAEAGFNMVLPKPVQPNDLITAISNLMASASAEGTAE